jgi:D-alanine-D-alanine ligase
MAEKIHKVRLGILFGGKSGEHEVSLSSAASVISALDPAEFEVTAVGITKSGRLADEAETRAMLPAILHKRVRFFEVSAQAPIAALRSEPGNSDHAIEIVFPLLHGPYGEDGAACSPRLWAWTRTS